MSKKRRHSGPPRCKECDAIVVFFRDAATRRWRIFEPKALSYDRAGTRGVPVHWDQAWDTHDLAAEMASAMPGCDPYDEVRALDFYLPHRCLRYAHRLADNRHLRSNA